VAQDALTILVPTELDREDQLSRSSYWLSNKDNTAPWRRFFRIRKHGGRCAASDTSISAQRNPTHAGLSYSLHQSPSSSTNGLVCKKVNLIVGFYPGRNIIGNWQGPSAFNLTFQELGVAFESRMNDFMGHVYTPRGVESSFEHPRPRWWLVRMS